MAEQPRAWKRRAFWRAHHEAWKRSDLNQKFRAEPEAAQRKLLYRRHGLSPPLSPPVSPPLSPGVLSLFSR
jgi:hypothetical protein